MYDENKNNKARNVASTSCANDLLNKETLLTPHIASHKSMSNTLPANGLHVVVTNPNDSLSPIQLTQQISTTSLSSHIPNYRITTTSQNHPTVLKNADSDVMSVYRPIYTNSLKVSDKTSGLHAVEMSTHSTESSHRPLPHIHTVTSAPHLTDNFYRLHDPLSLQQSAITIIPGTDNVTLQHSSTIDNDEDINQPTPIVSARGIANDRQTITNSTQCLDACCAIPANLSTSNSGQSTILNIPENMLIHEVTGNLSEIMKAESGYPRAFVIGTDRDGKDIIKLTNNSIATKDLLHQAVLQTTMNSPHKSPNNEIIDYDYSTNEIEDPEEILLPHTFCSTGIAINKQELLMMNIQLGSSTAGLTKTTSSVTGGSNWIMLQPAAVNDPIPDNFENVKQKRHSRLSEETDESYRKDVIALKMREKRANESEEQKNLRRIREAERTKRKRANESADQKIRRRNEAAIRARQRRANMSHEERCVDLKKAAERMRLRRKLESDEEKQARRCKAAERMRNRRASETPEQRALRRQNIALKLKVKRKHKEKTEKRIAHELPPPLSPTSFVHGPKIVKVQSSADFLDIEQDTGISLQRLQPAQLPPSQIVMSSGVSANVALVNVDPSLLQGNILSSMDLAALNAMSVNIKNSQNLNEMLEIVDVKEESDEMSQNNLNGSNAQVILPSISHIKNIPESLSIPKSLPTSTIIQSSSSHLPHIMQAHTSQISEISYNKYSSRTSVKNHLSQ